MKKWYIPLFSGAFTLRLHPLFLLLFAASLWGDYAETFCLGWLCAVLHETAHILSARALRVAICGVDFLPFGICARLKNPYIKNPLHEVFIALSGPFCSFLLALLFYALPPHPWAVYGARLNLSLGLINLLPCLPLDGGRVLRASLTHMADPYTAWKITKGLTLCLSLSLVGLGVLFLWTRAFSFSFLMIGTFVLSNLCTEQMGASKQALKELLYYKQKLDPDAFHETKLLTAHEHLPARKLLRQLSYHRYITVQVVDDENRIIKTLTESEIIEGLLSKSIRLTLKDL